MKEITETPQNEGENQNEDKEIKAEEVLEEVAATAAGAEEGISGAGAAAGGITVYVPEKKKRGRGAYRFIKRVFDIFSSGIMLLLLSWLILLCLLIKWLEDFHNPVYVSKRVGKDGKIFNFYKIRTMRPDADKLKQQLIDQGLNEADGPAFKMKNDPRITKVGKFYRKFSIDELLQLINIFNGTMSVVGPRPPIPKEVEAYTEEQKHRLDVKGGLLCLWQIQKNRNAITFDEWVKLDLEYIEKQSVGLDLKIIFKGAWMVVFDHSGE
jgi:lipopolysaccharide/colanic/teichoic acid biosynthesis glycosyltransferase